jgi:flagellin
MSIKIGSNLASINAQRRLGDATSSLSSIYEKLSSGQRINRASDDAAGLAIADDLNAKGRIFTQAIRNGNDGISLLNIADSAIDALTGVVTRIRELSEQAANGTYSAQQRKALDAEAQALSKEFTRITQSTSFNGLRIFDGSLGTGVRLQLGVGVTESINASIGGNIGTGDFLSATSFSTEGTASRAVSLGDLNGDGVLDLVTAGYDDSGNGYATVRLGLGNGNFGTATSFSTESNVSLALSLGDLNGDGVLDLVTAGFDDSYNGSATVRLGLGNGNFGTATRFSTEGNGSRALSLGDLNGDGVLDLVTAGFDDSNNGYATVRLGLGNGNFGTATAFSTEGNGSRAVSLGDLNGDGVLDLVSAGNDDSGNGYATVRLGLGNGNFGTATSFSTEGNGSRALSLGDLNGDGVLDLVTAGYDDSYNGSATVRLGLGNGNFGTATAFSTESNRSYALSLGDLNGDGVLDLVTAGTDDSNNGYATVRLGLGNGNFGTATTFSTEGYASNALSLGDLNGDGVLDLVTAGYSYEGGFNYNGYATVRLAQAEEGLGAMLGFSLKTKSEALQSMGMLDRTLENLAEQRGTIGASQSRVSIAISNLQTAKENFAAAESRIRDADIASEAANLVRTQILQQAAASVLAQANQGPALALRLLQ